MKKFIILGNVNALTYKDIFKGIVENKIWIGPSIHSGDREFRVPARYVINSKSKRIDKNGVQYVRVDGVRWYTNLDFKERHEDLILHKKYNETDYPKYDNYDAINVDKTVDIPMDYIGVMGVPITFIDKYNPEQFEILGMTDARDNSDAVESLRTDKEHRNRGIVHGETKEKYARILIRNKKVSME